MRATRIHIVLICSAAVLAGAFLLKSASGPAFTPRDKAYYANPATVNFVRPGLVIKITSAEISADGAIKARFRLADPKNLPLDREGVTTPGAVSVSFIAAYIPKGRKQYTAYTTRSQTSPINGVTAMQAGTDSGGTFEKVGDGEYVYTFKTRAPQGFDKTVTHSIGAYGSRSLTEFDMGTQYDDDVFNFVPDGSKVTVVRDVVRTQTCNKCHDQMAFHGGPRRSVELCVLCHQPQSVDPDTGNSVDMVPMIHRIHAGAALPSVKAGKKYQIIGHNQTVADYSDVNFPADVRRCQVCHEAPATQAENMFNATRAACGTCHDDVNFDTGAGHVDLPQTSDSQCTGCHIRQGELELDASIIGAHTIPTESRTLPGTVFELLAVDNAGPGKAPIVTFSVKDKSGKPILPSAMSGLNLYMAGPNSDFATYVREDARKADGDGAGRYFWQFNKPLPADAKGSWTIGIEGRRDVKLLEGTKKEQTVRDAGRNKTLAFSVDGSPVQPRRKVVATENCNKCHFQISFHGGNRNSVDQCPICHSPTAVAGKESIDLRTFIHRIHTGKELERPYVIGNANFNEVGYPGDRRNCGACHVNGSEQLPLHEDLLNVVDPSGPLNPVPPTTAACTSCHESTAVASHALANTSKAGEACAVCHGPDADKSVSRAHAR